MAEISQPGMATLPEARFRKRALFLDSVKGSAVEMPGEEDGDVKPPVRRHSARQDGDVKSPLHGHGSEESYGREVAGTGRRTKLGL